jgi:hypothetical protein
MNTLNRLVLAALALAVLLASSSASAESGWVEGRFRFWQKNGNYCPQSRSPCTGATYLYSEFDKKQPLRHADVFVWNATKGNIGTGSTDSNGNFLIQWSYSGTLTEEQRAQTRVWIRPWHAGDRFRVNYKNGQYPNNWTGYFTLELGSTQSEAQPVGHFYIGSSASPNHYYNVYWAAEMTWRTRLNTSGWFQAYFTGAEIRGFADSMPGFLGDCVSSCALGSEMKIQLDADAGLKPQARVMHELGHLAIYNSHAWHPAEDCYDMSGAGWWANEPEYPCAAFEEGYATFLANSTLYGYTATAPHYCYSSSYCPTGTFNLESSSGYPCNGPGQEYYWPLTHMRYLWDVYDSIDDGETISEGSAGRWWRMYRVYQHYPSGTGSCAADEHWDPTYSYLDNPYGRGATSYRWNYDDYYSFDIDDSYDLNCGLP